MSGYWVKLRGMPYRTTMDDILEFLTGVQVKGGKRGIHFPISQKNIEWGEAFVELDTEDDLEKAKLKNNQHMGRRYIEVFNSTEGDMHKACKGSRDMIIENGNERSKRGRSRSPVSDRMNGNYVLRLKGLPYNTAKGDIKDFFQGLKILPDGMSILVDHSGKALGDAFVQFASYRDAKLAKERSGNKIGHRYIEVFESSLDEANAEIRRQMEINEMAMRPGDRSPPRSRDIRDGPLPERSRAFSRGICTIGVRGLSVHTRPDDLFRFFRPVIPLSADMRFSTASSEGEAFVDFANEEDAYSAMHKNRERLGTHPVFLTMLPPKEDVSYERSIGVAEYDRRDRELSRGLQSSRGYGDRDSYYGSSRYY